MIFKNIQFHNVEEITKEDGGYTLWRLPAAVRERMNEGLKTETAAFSCGVELRFRILGDEAKLILRAREAAEAQVAHIYYGSFQGGWQYSSKIIGTEPTCIRIPRPDHLDTLRAITAKQRLPFAPDIVRIVLPYGHCFFLDAEGEIEPPREEDLPAKSYLAYGSSITHGSLALGQPYTYPFRIAQKLGCDYYNLGFAGTARLEAAMAEYIVSRKDWDFASVEMGVNLLGVGLTPKEFEQRTDDFTRILSQDPRPVFATSIFGLTDSKQQAEASLYREIIKKYASERLIFTDGLDLLNREDYISQDLVHPSLEGMEQIVERWSARMKETLG